MFSFNHYSYKFMLRMMNTTIHTSMILWSSHNISLYPNHHCICIPYSHQCIVYCAHTCTQIYAHKVCGIYTVSKSYFLKINRIVVSILQSPVFIYVLH